MGRQHMHQSRSTSRQTLWSQFDSQHVHGSPFRYVLLHGRCRKLLCLITNWNSTDLIIMRICRPSMHWRLLSQQQCCSSFSHVWICFCAWLAMEEKLCRFVIYPDFQAPLSFYLSARYLCYFPWKCFFSSTGACFWCDWASLITRIL